MNNYSIKCPKTLHFAHCVTHFSVCSEKLFEIRKILFIKMDFDNCSESLFVPGEKHLTLVHLYPSLVRELLKEKNVVKINDALEDTP